VVPEAFYSSRGGVQSRAEGCAFVAYRCVQNGIKTGMRPNCVHVASKQKLSRGTDGGVLDGSVLSMATRTQLARIANPVEAYPTFW
jgi:hypothetical protein